jgi:phosphoglycerate dehydrogenase-like enzyme
VRILFTDLVFDDDLSVERSIAGADAHFDTFRAKEPEAIPESAWDACNAILVNLLELPERVAELAHRCRIVVRAGVGYNNIDVAAFAQRRIPVCNTPDYGTTDVADMALAMLLAFARGIVSFDRALSTDPVGNWNYTAGPVIRRLRGLCFGVLGLGRIGTAAALRARAFGMDVAFYDPYLPSGAELAFGFRRARSLRELLGMSDVVSIHTPLTDETRAMINTETLAAMRRNSILINTARGAICDLTAIRDALKNGHLAAAGLDVLPAEPPRPDEPLLVAWRAEEPWIRGRLILAPHAAWYSPSSFYDLRSKSMTTLVRYLRDGVLENCVNADLLNGKQSWRM